MEMLIFILANADDQRNMLRIHRRHLRDKTDPFQIPEARFIELFRFNKETTIALLSEISAHMKSGSYQRDIGQDFLCPMSKTMICRIVKEISFIIQNKLMDIYLRFPTTLEEQYALQQRFFTYTGFPGAVGAIDCTHVKIKKPAVDVEYCYRNRSMLSYGPTYWTT